ncbi:divalent metal cation transporter [Galbibacter sp. BG1]|uniref:NRAMP family divalent metal transporter n=1 Tax=Galbibacter sp. BG1 TaxID=1170699 RepID=UPI0015BE4660|nr:divalent metal cation transporter [Galbibacter sp. BG1]QLE02447.1 divalent metal cation transporter [Galbibacter sp. BG1]
MLLTQKLNIIVKNLGPAFFIIGYVVGTGSVTSMVVSGANFGLSLSWALFLSCFFTFFLIAAISKLTIVSGETLLYNFKKHFGKPVTLFIILALIISIVSSCIGIMGVVAEVVVEWIRVNTNIDFLNQIYISLLFIALLITLFWLGKHQYFLNIMAFLVGFMALSFIITSIIVLKESEFPLKAYFPELPEAGNTGLVIAGMVGTTMAGICLISRSILVQEQNWKIADLKTERKDAIYSMVMTFLISLAIMISATGTLYFQDIKVDSPIDLMHALGPWAGEFALTLFTLGILGAGLSSIFPNLLLTPWIISDYKKEDRNMKKPLYKLLVVIVALTCLIVPIMGGKPVWILIASQAFSPFIMPLITLFLLILINKKSVMGDYRAKLGLNIALIATLIFNLFMMVIAIESLIAII